MKGPPSSLSVPLARRMKGRATEGAGGSWWWKREWRVRRSLFIEAGVVAKRRVAVSMNVDTRVKRGGREGGEPERDPSARSRSPLLLSLFFPGSARLRDTSGHYYYNPPVDLRRRDMGGAHLRLVPPFDLSRSSPLLPFSKAAATWSLQLELTNSTPPPFSPSPLTLLILTPPSCLSLLPGPLFRSQIVGCLLQGARLWSPLRAGIPSSPGRRSRRRICWCALGC